MFVERILAVHCVATHEGPIVTGSTAKLFRPGGGALW